MYPLVGILVLGVAAAEHRTGVEWTGLPLSVLWVGVATYHSYLRTTAVACGFAGERTAVPWRAPVGGLTVPSLSLVAFVLVTGLVAGRRSGDGRRPAEAGASTPSEGRRGESPAEFGLSPVTDDVASLSNENV